MNQRNELEALLSIAIDASERVIQIIADICILEGEALEESPEIAMHKFINNEPRIAAIKETYANLPSTV